MADPSGGGGSDGTRVTEYVAPLVLVVLVSLGIWWYVSQVKHQIDRRPADPPSDLRRSFPPLPGAQGR